MKLKDLQGPYKHVFLTEDEISDTLKSMIDDEGLQTGATKSQKTDFRNLHAAYLRGHPKVNPENYLANLRTMIKIRSSK